MGPVSPSKARNLKPRQTSALTQENSILKLWSGLITPLSLWFSSRPHALHLRQTILSVAGFLLMHTYWYFALSVVSDPRVSSLLYYLFWLEHWQDCHSSTLPCSSSISIHDKCDIYGTSGRFHPRDVVGSSCFSWQEASSVQYMLTAAGDPTSLWFTFNFYYRWAAQVWVDCSRRPRPNSPQPLQPHGNHSKPDAIHFSEHFLMLLVMHCDLSLNRNPVQAGVDASIRSGYAPWSPPSRSTCTYYFQTPRANRVRLCNVG